jgi:hypothetical protein
MVLFQDSLNLSRFDSLATNLDLLVLATQKDQIAVLIELDEISCEVGRICRFDTLGR